MDNARVTAIVTTWNQCEDTVECLSSLSKVNYNHLSILVVDNASEDNTEAVVRRKFPNVDYLTIKPRNVGFAKAVNIGVKHAIEKGTDYIFVLSNDTIVSPNIVKELLAQSFRQNVGLLVPKIYYYDYPEIIWSVGYRFNSFLLNSTDDQCGKIDKFQWEKIVERPQVTGCAMFVDKRIVDKYDFFDERFFLYYEDADLSLRFYQSGLKNTLVPQAYVWHKVARASHGPNTPYQRYWLARSSVVYFRKHTNHLNLYFILVFRFLSALKTTFRLIRLKRISSVQAHWQGLWDGLFTPI